MADTATLLEAEKRGIPLPPEKQAILDEARKRGIVPPAVDTSAPGFGAEDFAPMVGAIGGGYIGKKVGFPAPGAMIGTAAGGVVKNVVKAVKGQPVDWMDALHETTVDALTGGTGSAAGARMLPKVTAAEQEAIALAAKAKIPISADLLHPSWFTKGVAWLGNAFLPGRLAATKYRKEMHTVSERMANDLLADVATEPSVKSAMEGLPLREGMREAKKKFYEIGKEGYQAQAELSKEYGQRLVRVPNFRKALGNLKQSGIVAGDAQINKYLDDLLKKTDSGSVTLHDLTGIYNKINTKVKGLKNPAATEGLFDALHTDMKAVSDEGGKEIAQVFVNAKAKWKDKITFDKVHSIFQRSSKTDEFGNVYFDPDRFMDSLDNPQFGIATQLERTFGKDGAAERMKGLRNFGNLMRYSRMEATREIKATGGDWYKYLGIGDAAAGVTGLGGMVGSWWLPVPYGLSYAATLQTLKPSSTMKNLMKMKLGPVPPRLGAAAGAGAGVGVGEAINWITETNE